ncbi:MAG: undecaprenyl-diphosphate phosphatase [candidate division NC10 bacterium]|nr:undecaprenyl-diphosphate phosphatase [candidate division NC10 bacterium]
MSLLRPLILGTVQGITEFLPISSSAHLILIPWILGWPDLGLAFDVALHLGTLFSLLLYFRTDWWNLIRGFADSLWEQRISGDPFRRMSWLLLLGSLPAAFVGLYAEEAIEKEFRHPASVGLLMILLGGLLFYADQRGAMKKGVEEVGLWEALAIGLGQSAALFPGVSRSGITITVALLLGLRREAAARFSFLLASPLVAGAALLEGIHLLRRGFLPGEAISFLLGISSATLFGFLSIRYLLRYLQRGRLAPFAYYRWMIGFLVLLLYGVRVSVMER